ncbi:MAG: hypothetical protein U0Q11_03970 [Vicinamibacterales bacterium]
MPFLIHQGLAAGLAALRGVDVIVGLPGTRRVGAGSISPTKVAATRSIVGFLLQVPAWSNAAARRPTTGPGNYLVDIVSTSEDDQERAFPWPEPWTFGDTSATWLQQRAAGYDLRQT